MNTCNITEVCHVYSPGAWHDDAYIVADTEALLELKAAIEEALENKIGRRELFVNDGEGYTLCVLKVDNPIIKNRLETPYTEDIAVSSRQGSIDPTCLLYPESLPVELQGETI